MYNEGYTYIMNIDRSDQCIDYMKSQYPKMPNTFQCILDENHGLKLILIDLKMNAMEMDFAGDVFTTVLDKGLLDAICVS